MVHTDELALLAAVCEQPAEDTPRLVYADYLDEQGDETLGHWAAFIRASVAGKATEWAAERMWRSSQIVRFSRDIAGRIFGGRYDVVGTVAQWDRGFPGAIRLSSVRAWEQACADGVFLRVPVTRCEVRGREPYVNGIPGLPHPRWWWRRADEKPRRPEELPGGVMDRIVTRSADRWWWYTTSHSSALDVAWRAFAVAGRAACRQPTAEVTA